MANAQLQHYFLPTSHGGRYLCMGGYMYRVNKRRTEGWVSWKCQKSGCGSTISTVNDLISKQPSAHNYEATEAKIQVEEAWLETLATMPQDDRCLQLTDYITTQWVEGDLPSWNHFETDGPRTNNHLEGWHGRMKKVISKAHPNVFEMAKFLLNEQKLNEIRLVQYRAGQKLPAKRTKYQNLDTRLNNLKNRLNIGVLPLMKYADAASHLLKLN